MPENERDSDPYDPYRFPELDTDTDDFDFDFEDGVRAPGRISKANHEAIQQGFQEMVEIAKRIAGTTGLTVGQIIDQWTATRTWKHVRKNMWNTYAQYFKDNHDAEIARISQGASRLLNYTYAPLIQCMRMQRH